VTATAPAPEVPTAPEAPTRVRSVLVAAVTAAVLVGLAAALSGGRLGAGPFDPVSVPAGPVALAVLGWVLVPGLVVALLAVPIGTSGAAARPVRRRARTTTPAPEVAAEPDEVTDAPSGDVEEPSDEEPDPAETAGDEGVGPGGGVRG